MNTDKIQIKRRTHKEADTTRTSKRFQTDKKGAESSIYQLRMDHDYVKHLYKCLRVVQFALTSNPSQPHDETHDT